jgi:hypothetical protein
MPVAARRVAGRVIAVSPVLAVAVLLLCVAALACAAVALFYAVRKPPPPQPSCPEPRMMMSEPRMMMSERRMVVPDAEVQKKQPEVRVIAIDANAGGAPPGTHPQVGYVVVQKPESASSAFALYGAPSTTRAGRWNYYAIPPGAGGVKVPLHAGGRDCMDEVGCELLFDGDAVSAPDAGVPAGVAKIYRSSPPTYLPPP